MNELTNQQRIEQDIVAGRINTTNDVLFKWLLGRYERKDLLIDFLNAVLDRQQDRVIKDLQYRNSEMLPSFNDDKLTRLDILCTIEDGTQVDVEVQVVDRQNMDRRAEYYACHLFLDGLKRGEKYQDIKPVITISLLSYVMVPEEPMHSMYGLYNPETKRRLNHDLELHFLEIPKLQKKPVRLMSHIERWIAYFSKKLSQKELEELAVNDTNIQHALDATKTFFMNDSQRLAYINHEMAIFDYNSDIAAAEEKGVQRGRAEGRQEGRQEERLAMARNLKLKGIDLNTIAECSGLSLHELQSL